jgi:hypothetical protein
LQFIKALGKLYGNFANCDTPNKSVDNVNVFQQPKALKQEAVAQNKQSQGVYAIENLLLRHDKISARLRTKTHAT